MRTNIKIRGYDFGFRRKRGREEKREIEEPSEKVIFLLRISQPRCDISQL